MIGSICRSKRILTEFLTIMRQLCGHEPYGILHQSRMH
ncbi:hypothetical protein SXCC_01540 [Gluconacetobacter sp. SXCC-1]|nr:hypothetical protein SXCC_01540 [Gluconacetobacter sp. SXCC-1]